MATFPNTFRADSAGIHGEHQQLLLQLSEFASALEAMGPSTLGVDPMGSGRVRRSVTALQEILPGHFRREETVLLDAVAPVSPELAEFSRHMRREHQQFTARLEQFAAVLAKLAAGNGAGPAFLKVKEEGESLALDLSAHIALEEQQLDGFL